MTRIPARRKRPAARHRALLGAALGAAALCWPGEALAAALPDPIPIPRPRPDPGAPGPGGAAVPALPGAGGLSILDSSGFEAPLAPLGVPPSSGTTAPLDIGGRRAEDAQLRLEARLTEDGEPLRSGVMWHVFGAAPDASGHLPLIGEERGGTAEFLVPPGEYIVHAGFGWAMTITRVAVGYGGASASVVLDAGGLRLQAALGNDEAAPLQSARFEVFSMMTDDTGQRIRLVQAARPGELLRLSAGTYQVVSHYGEANSVTSAEVIVEAGRVVEATLIHQAAEVTLKLVAAPGGEALANTSWSVLGPSGETVVTGIGAFPSFVLAAGEYVAVAEHDGTVFRSAFTVEPGRDRDIEVLAARAAT